MFEVVLYIIVTLKCIYIYMKFLILVIHECYQKIKKNKIKLYLKYHQSLYSSISTYICGCSTMSKVSMQFDIIVMLEFNNFI